MLPEKPYIEDTIVACATGAGIGGINVIRVSGIDTEKIAKKFVYEGTKLHLEMAEI